MHEKNGALYGFEASLHMEIGWLGKEHGRMCWQHTFALVYLCVRVHVCAVKCQGKVKKRKWVLDMPTVTSTKNFLCNTPGSLSRHVNKIPHSKAGARLLATTAAKAGVSEPITAQADPSADNHSFGWSRCSFVELSNVSKTSALGG